MKTTHRGIKRFHLTGKVVSSTAFVRVQEMYMNILEETMREQGYVPRLELHPEWTTEYKDTHYNFEISVYGSYVGRKQAWEIDGIDRGKPIYTHQSKSKESSSPQEQVSKEK